MCLLERYATCQTVQYGGCLEQLIYRPRTRTVGRFWQSVCMPTRADRLDAVIGGKSAKAIEKALGLSTVGEFVRHYPRRMNKRGELTDLAALAEGDDVTVQAEIESASSRR